MGRSATGHVVAALRSRVREGTERTESKDDKAVGFNTCSLELPVHSNKVSSGEPEMSY